MTSRMEAREALRVVRCAQRLTQAALAASAGVRREVVSLTEVGRLPWWSCGPQLAAALGYRDDRDLIAEAGMIDPGVPQPGRARNARRCDICRRPIGAYRGRGRPRVRCRRCGSDGAKVARARRARAAAPRRRASR